MVGKHPWVGTGRFQLSVIPLSAAEFLVVARSDPKTRYGRYSTALTGPLATGEIGRLPGNLVYSAGRGFPVGALPDSAAARCLRKCRCHVLPTIDPP